MGGERSQRTEAALGLSREGTISVEGWEGPQRWGTGGRPKQPSINYTPRALCLEIVRKAMKGQDEKATLPSHWVPQRQIIQLSVLFKNFHRNTPFSRRNWLWRVWSYSLKPSKQPSMESLLFILQVHVHFVLHYGISMFIFKNSFPSDLLAKLMLEWARSGLPCSSAHSLSHGQNGPRMWW